MRQTTSSSIQLGIAPLLWPHHANLESLNTTIDSINKADFDGCELSQCFPQDPFLLKNSLKQAGIKISSSQFHSYLSDKKRYNDTINRFLDHMHFLNAIGAKKIIVCEYANNTFEDDKKPMLSNQAKASSEQFKRFIDGLNKMGDLAYGANMQVIYQPHIGTIIHSAEDIEKLMEKTDEKKISLLMDTAHFSLLEIDAIAMLKKYTNRINYIYLKDIDKRILNKVKKENLSYHSAKALGLFTALGKGYLNFSPLLKTLKSLSYHGWIIAYGSDTDKEMIHESAKNTRKFMKLKLGL